MDLIQISNPAPQPAAPAAKQGATGVAALVEEGLREAAAIANPVARARHRAAWAHRLSTLDPDRAAAMLAELPQEDLAARVELLLTVLGDRLRRGDADLEPQFSQVLETGRRECPDLYLRTLNTLSELCIELADRDREAAASQLRKLAPAVRALGEGEAVQSRVLGSALVGEALLALEDPLGRELLAEAEALARPYPGRDPIFAFLVDALSARDPERALALAAEMSDPAARLETRLRLLERLPDDAPARPDLLALVRAGLEEELGGDAVTPEGLVRLAHGVTGSDPALARELFERAVRATEGQAPQVRSLQLTGIGAAVARFDREWAGKVFRASEAAAREEPERVRRVTALSVLGNEMAESYPRDAAAVLERAVAEGRELEAVWEYAHALDVLFRPDRSPYLDLRAVRPMIEQVLARLTDEDPRIPGVIGLPDAARWMVQIDPERSVDVLERWLRAAEAAEDADGMTQAALAIHQVDPRAGLEALARARAHQERRVDCMALGEFSRCAAAVAPEMVLEIADRIPDTRERTEAYTAVAVHLYESDPDRALAILRALERPVDRSSALLRLVDRLLNLEDRPQPQPLLEELP